MGTAIVKREDVPILVHEHDRAVAAVHDKPALGFQLFKTARVYEIRRRGIHGRLIREVSASAPFGKDLPRMSIRSTDARNLAKEGSDFVALTVVPTKSFATVSGMIEINLIALTNGATRRKEVIDANIPRKDARQPGER